RRPDDHEKSAPIFVGQLPHGPLEHRLTKQIAREHDRDQEFAEMTMLLQIDGHRRDVQNRVRDLREERDNEQPIDRWSTYKGRQLRRCGLLSIASVVAWCSRRGALSAILHDEIRTALSPS